MSQISDDDAAVLAMLTGATLGWLSGDRIPIRIADVRLDDPGDGGPRQAYRYVVTTAAGTRIELCLRLLPGVES